jgi:Vault protein inter-alpha-trypsin domain
MRMEGKDRVIDAVLKERAQARQDYDDAVARGRQAAIAEEERPDVFTMREGTARIRRARARVGTRLSLLAACSQLKLKVSPYRMLRSEAQAAPASGWRRIWTP